VKDGTDSSEYDFGHDLPRQNPWQEDRLGFAPSAEGMAKAVIRISAPNGYVIGLHGHWGSGKSTMLNFVLAHIKKHNQENEHDCITHVDFRPWIVSGHQDLIAAFFKILSEELSTKKTKRQQLLRRIFGLVYRETDGLVNAAATVALAVDPTGGIGTRVAGRLVTNSISGALKPFLENPSLQKAYEDLKVQLRNSKKRFLVTIDDIDRLEDEEVRSIMQLVKSIGQLPNIVYILSYDREIIRRTLSKDTHPEGINFSDKIVQHEIDLPKPLKSDLLALLDENISFLLEEEEDSQRWQYIVRDGVRRWIRSPRDVERLSNAVKFTWPRLKGELDRQDLLAMEGLRLFDPAVYNWVRDGRDFLFNQGHFSFSKDEQSIAEIERLKRRVPEDQQGQVLQVLSTLFPSRAKWFQGDDFFGFDDDGDSIKRRGIGSEDGYDTYFGMHPAADVIPKAVITEILAVSTNAEEIEAVFRTYLDKFDRRGKLMISKLLDELRMHFRSLKPPQPTQALLDAVFGVGEDLLVTRYETGMFELSPRSQASFVIRHMLSVWGKKEAGEHLISSFEATASPAFLSEIYVDRGRELGEFQSSTSETITISEADFERLGQVLLPKIVAAAADGSLSKAPYFFNIIRAWNHLDSNIAPTEWLNVGISSSAEFLLKVIRSMVSYSVGAKNRKYSWEGNPDAKIYDMEAIISAGNRYLQSAPLTPDERNLLTEVLRGAQKARDQAASK